MTENVAILLVVLVAVNIVLVVLVAVAVWRARRVRKAEAWRAALVATHGERDHPTPAGPRPAAVVASSATRAAVRTDPLTGLLTPGEWTRILADEEARIHRYGRPATVILVELDGLDRLVGTLGQDAADRVLPAMAGSLRRHARGADHVARLGAGRFGILLPETGEIEAVNYVERVRQICELWLESGAIALRLAIGWASPAVEGSLGDAAAEAQERMFAELRRGARRDADPGSPDAAPPSTGLEGAPAPA